MRIIFKKLARGEFLGQEQYKALMEYAEQLRLTSEQSYAVFYERYADILYREYNTFIPHPGWNNEDLINYLIAHQEIISSLHKGDFSVLPQKVQLFLHQNPASALTILNLDIINLLAEEQDLTVQLPSTRTQEIVIKYEDANPYKEIGLKSHLERLSRYLFISRLQTYRYLTRGKASKDKIEIISGDCLGGIFTNKEKSIYYYIFLTEDNPVKAANACRLLNVSFYGLQERGK